MTAGQTCSRTLWEDSSPEREVHVGLNTKGAPEIYGHTAVAASEAPRRGARDSPNDE